MTSYPLARAAIFPLWEPLNNAIVTSVTGRGNAAAHLAAVYRAAGVGGWALWLPSRTADLDTADRIEQIALLRRDTTTLVMQRDTTALVMHLSLLESVPRHSQVVGTSIASANFEAPVGADALDPPEVVPGLNGWVFVHDCAAVCWRVELSARHGLRDLRRRSRAPVAKARVCAGVGRARTGRRTRRRTADRNASVHANGPTALRIARIHRGRPL